MTARGCGARARRPKDHGTCDSQYCLSLQLTEAEVEKVVLDEKEYETSQWLEPDAIVSGDFHPALKFAVHSYMASLKFDELQQAVLGHPDNDVEVAKLARDLVGLTRALPVHEGASDYRVRAPRLQYECAVTTEFA